MTAFFITLFMTIIIIVNTVLWRLYRRDLLKRIQTQQEQLRNAYCYVDELQTRCERYRTAAVTEALAAQTRTEPVVKVYPINRGGMNWLIESNLN